VKRATSETWHTYYETFHFNPRPREEGDSFNADFSFWDSFISIHALVKRATAEVEEIKRTIDISIHALVKRATYDPEDAETTRNISIHALVKRAT